jgi:hypothetical protein
MTVMWRYTRLMVRYWAAASGVALIGSCLGCGGGGSNGTLTGADLAGSWGGTESSGAALPATLVVATTSSSLSLPCGADGAVNQALTLDANGHFSAAGTYTGEIALPSPNAVPAVYSGVVSGSRMTLTVTNSNTQQQIDTYTLVKGQSAPAFTGACPG